MQRILALTLSLAPLLSACGGAAAADPADAADAGYRALGKGDYSGAVSHFDTALATAAPGADTKELALARCEALAHTDPKAVEASMKSIQGLSAKDYGLIARACLSSKAYTEAGQVMHLGVTAFPDEPAMETLKNEVANAVAKSGDKAANDALKGLGYLGGDEQ